MPSKSVCPFCDVTFTTHRILSHIVNRHKDVFKTKFNNDTLKTMIKSESSRYFIYLINEDTNDEIQLYGCLGCCTSFKTSDSCDSHFITNPSHKQLHLEKCRELSDTDSNAPTGNDAEEVKALKEQIKKLQANNDKLNTRLNNCLDMQSKSDTCFYVTYDLLRSWGAINSRYTSDVYNNIYNECLRLYNDESLEIMGQDDLLEHALKLDKEDYFEDN